METLSDSELAFLELLARIWTARRKIWRSVFVLLIHTKKNWQGNTREYFALHRSEFIMLCDPNLLQNN